jgi:hypothetical protein
MPGTHAVIHLPALGAGPWAVIGSGQLVLVTGVVADWRQGQPTLTWRWLSAKPLRSKKKSDFLPFVS